LFKKEVYLILEILLVGFFKNTEKVSDVVDVNVLNRFSVILTAVSSGSEINYERFDKYAKETAELYV